MGSPCVECKGAMPSPEEMRSELVPLLDGLASTSVKELSLIRWVLLRQVGKVDAYLLGMCLRCARQSLDAVERIGAQAVMQSRRGGRS